MCPHKITEKRLNLSKFQSLKALKIKLLLLFFFLHGEQLPSQVFIFLLSRFLFTVANTNRKIQTIQSK